MKTLIKSLSTLLAIGLIIITFPSSGFTGEEKGDSKKAASQTPDGFYIMKDRDDVQRRVYKEQQPGMIKTVPVTDGIYLLTGAGGNMHIGVCVGDEGVLLIDDLLPEFTESVMSEIRKLTDKPVRYVINTHWHWDHTGGNGNMAKQGAIIIAQKDVMPWMTTWQISGMSGAPKKPQPAGGLPVITFKDKITLRFNGHTIKISNAGPSHTAGDSIVHFVEKDVFFMGDIYLSGSYLSLDLNTGGDINGLIKSLDRILPEIKTSSIVVPGHGKLSNRTELEDFRDMVVTLRDRIKLNIDDGKTLDEILAAKPTADLDEKWSNIVMSPDVVVKFIHASLTN